MPRAANTVDWPVPRAYSYPSYPTQPSTPWRDSTFCIHKVVPAGEEAKGNISRVSIIRPLPLGEG